MYLKLISLFDKMEIIEAFLVFSILELKVLKLLKGLVFHFTNSFIKLQIFCGFLVEKRNGRPSIKVSFMASPKSVL